MYTKITDMWYEFTKITLTQVNTRRKICVHLGEVICFEEITYESQHYTSIRTQNSQEDWIDIPYEDFQELIREAYSFESGDDGYESDEEWKWKQ